MSGDFETKLKAFIAKSVGPELSQLSNSMNILFNEAKSFCVDRFDEIRNGQEKSNVSGKSRAQLESSFGTLESTYNSIFYSLGMKVSSGRFENFKNSLQNFVTQNFNDIKEYRDTFYSKGGSYLG